MEFADGRRTAVGRSKGSTFCVTSQATIRAYANSKFFFRFFVKLLSFRISDFLI